MKKISKKQIKAIQNAIDDEILKIVKGDQDLTYVQAAQQFMKTEKGKAMAEKAYQTEKRYNIQQDIARRKRERNQE